MIHEILVVENKKDLIDTLTEQFKNTNELSFKRIVTNELEECLSDIPSSILINEDYIGDNSIIDICRLIRNNEDNSITPIMVFSSSDDIKHEKEVLKEDVQYYIKKPIDNECVFCMIKNIVKLIYRNRGISPLTKLPRKYYHSIRIEKALI